MTYRIKAALDPEAEVALYTIMKRTGWSKSQVMREAIWAVAKSQGLVYGRSPDHWASREIKAKG